MLDDDQNHPDRPTDPTPDRPATARTRAWGVSSAVLALLMAGTAWVVASWASAWLVPPYLTLMAWILLPAGRPHRGDPAGVESDPADAPGPALPARGFADRPDPEASPAPAGPPEESEPGPGPSASKSPARGKRGGKGKARKGKALAEPTEATWIEVAPGKFVRSEAPHPRAEAGPHDPLVGVPVEVAATPRFAQDHEPAGDVPPAFDLVEGPGGEPAGGGVGSGSAEGIAVEEAGQGRGESEGVPAADGIAPQVEDAFGDPGADRPGIDPGPSDDREWAEPEARDRSGFAGEPTARAMTPEPEEAPEDAGAPGSEAVVEPAEGPEVDHASPPGAFEAADRPPLADLAPGDDGELVADACEPDPTETAVDETVLDDAGPAPDAPETSEIPPVDVSNGPDAPPGVPEGSDWWPRRLAPRALTRVGPDPRATSNAAPPRRPVRSHGPARRPPGPRRPRRRGAARHRQGTRTFPPRSPPRRLSAGA